MWDIQPGIASYRIPFCKMSRGSRNRRLIQPGQSGQSTFRVRACDSTWNVQLCQLCQIRGNRLGCSRMTSARAERECLRIRRFPAGSRRANSAKPARAGGPSCRYRYRAQNWRGPRTSLSRMLSVERRNGRDPSDNRASIEILVEGAVGSPVPELKVSPIVFGADPGHSHFCCAHHSYLSYRSLGVKLEFKCQAPLSFGGR